MWLLIKQSWRNLFRQRRRMLITVSAMAISLAVAIPTYGLVLGIRAKWLKGITEMNIGHVQLHDPAYPKGKALASTLQRPDLLLDAVRKTPGVLAAAPRVLGYALLSTDRRLPVTFLGLKPGHPALRKDAVRFGRPIDPTKPWRKDIAMECEAVAELDPARKHAVAVGTVFSPKAAKPGGACERIRIVGLSLKPISAGGGHAAPNRTPDPPATPPAAKERRSDAGVVPARALTVGLPTEDAIRAFGRPRAETVALLRNAAPVAITGVAPPEERKITFMARKVTRGRYLKARPAQEILVGHRLADTMRLNVGSEVFVQAATLDYASASFYQTFKVAGIYRTGIENIDRARVFIHIDDARKMMALEKRAHEIALKAKDPDRLEPLVGLLRSKVDRLKLRITTRNEGMRAGSRPLPAPIAITDPGDGKTGEVGLLIPDDLKRRFDDLVGLAAMASRVYGKTEVSAARRVEGQITRVDVGTLTRHLNVPVSKDPCAVYLPKQLADNWHLQPGDVLIPLAETGGETNCPRLPVAAVYTGKLVVPKPSKGPLSSDEPWILAAGAAHPGKADNDTDDDDDVGPPTGRVTMLVKGPAHPLRFVGVEAGREKNLSQLHSHVKAGRYLKEKGDNPESRWPLLLSRRAAERLKVSVGATVLVRTLDEDRVVRWRAGEVVGLLENWDAALPPMVLPYFQAQQINAPRLNARAQEILLLPKKGQKPELLASTASRQLSPLVRSWKEINPQMAGIAQMQDMFMSILLFIILAIAAMTVMNTMLMAVFERTREFGVLKSIGMRPRQVFGLIVLETFFLALFAVAIGGGAGLLWDHYLSAQGLDLRDVMEGFSAMGTFIDPVWHAIVTLKGVLMPMFAVTIVCFLVSLYPALRAGRIKPVEAFRHHG